MTPDDQYGRIIARLQREYLARELLRQKRRRFHQEEARLLSEGRMFAASGFPRRNRRRRNPYAHFHPKELGELAEQALCAYLSRIRIPSARFHGEFLPFDVVTVTAKYKLLKVQVKCTTCQRKSVYSLRLQRTGKLYQPGDFDFLAVFVLPEEAWYVIPARALGQRRTNLYFDPGGIVRRKRKVSFERFRDQWDYLK